MKSLKKMYIYLSITFFSIMMLNSCAKNNPIPEMNSRQGGAVSLFAGNVGGPGKGNGAGTASRFNTPIGTAIDTSGNIYVADSTNNTIRRITPDGTVSTVAGVAGVSGFNNGPASSATFNAPKGVAVDTAGNIYVTDSGNHTIRKITTDGRVSTLAGKVGVTLFTPSSALSSITFNNPTGIAFDNISQSLYVADTGNHIIRKITLAQGNINVSIFAGVQGPTGGYSDNLSATLATFNLPKGIAVDSAGNVYVADTGNHGIRLIRQGGVSTIAGFNLGLPGGGGGGYNNGAIPTSRFNGPVGIAVDSAFNVYVADTGNHMIRQLTPSPAVLPPTVYSIADITPTTTFNTTILAGTINVGGNGGVPGYANGLATAGASPTSGGAKFESPQGITVDSAGNIYVTDTLNHSIRKIIPDSTAGLYSVETIAGQPVITGSQNGSPLSARFSASPTGVVFDNSSGYIFVADSANHTIRAIPTPLSNNPEGGTVTIGSAGISGASDGSPCTPLPACLTAKFNNPKGVAVDAQGNVYVADTGNHLIRKISFTNRIISFETATITTFAGSLGSPIAGYSIDGTVAAGAKFSTPTGIAVNTDGSYVYVADTGNNVIRIISGGYVSTLAGAQPGGGGTAPGSGHTDSIFSASASFNGPQGVALDNLGDVYVADTGNHSIRKISMYNSSVTSVTTFAGSSDGSAAAAGYLDNPVGILSRFNTPQAVAVNNSGIVYVADTANQLIRQISPQGSVTTLAGNYSFSSGYIGGFSNEVQIGSLPGALAPPKGITIDSSGNIYTSMLRGIVEITSQ